MLSGYIRGIPVSLERVNRSGLSVAYDGARATIRIIGTLTCLMIGLVVEHGDTSNPSEYLLWQDVLLGLFDKHIEGLDVSQHYHLLTDRLTELAKGSVQAGRIFEIPARMSAVLKIKADLGVRLKMAYDTADRQLLKLIVDHELPDLLHKVDALRISHRRLWMSTNKPFGWEVLDVHYGGLSARLQSTKDRTRDYLVGEAGTDYFCSYHLMASPNRMT